MRMRSALLALLSLFLSIAAAPVAARADASLVCRDYRHDDGRHHKNCWFVLGRDKATLDANIRAFASAMSQSPLGYVGALEQDVLRCSKPGWVALAAAWFGPLLEGQQEGYVCGAPDRETAIRASVQNCWRATSRPCATLDGSVTIYLGYDDESVGSVAIGLDDNGGFGNFHETHWPRYERYRYHM